MRNPGGSCPICNCKVLERVFTYEAPPTGEIKFKRFAGGEYYREYVQCSLCRHFISTLKIDLSELYAEDYVSSNYDDENGVLRTFNRIVTLDPEKSDNVGRVKRIVNFAQKFFANHPKNPTILDVGSGLGVFPYGIKNEGWDCTALDPDKRAARHIEKNVKVKTICGDFLTTEIAKKFDVISFNKVLEHVINPAEMLSKARALLAKEGFVYIEVPDGEMAAYEGKGREEFFIDHMFVFSFTSLAMLGAKAGFHPILIERLRESSTKFTLRAFLTIKV